MGLSLRDQLIAAGLVPKQTEKPHKARPRQDSARTRGDPRPGATQDARMPPANAAELAAQRAQAEKFRREQEEGRRQLEKTQRRARVAQLRGLIDRHCLPAVAGEDFYNFVDQGRVRRIAVTSELRAQLLRGELLIARCSDRYDLVPAGAAEAIRGFDASALLAPQSEVTPAGTQAGEDPYRDYVVPDDLTW